MLTSRIPKSAKPRNASTSWMRSSTPIGASAPLRPENSGVAIESGGCMDAIFEPGPPSFPPQRLHPAVSQAAPKPLDRAEPKTAHPELSQRDLRREYDEGDSDGNQRADGAEQTEPVAVTQRREHERLEEVGAESHPARRGDPRKHLVPARRLEPEREHTQVSERERGSRDESQRRCDQSERAVDVVAQIGICPHQRGVERQTQADPDNRRADKPAAMRDRVVQNSGPRQPETEEEHRQDDVIDAGIEGPRNAEVLEPLLDDGAERTPAVNLKLTRHEPAEMLGSLFPPRGCRVGRGALRRGFLGTRTGSVRAGIDCLDELRQPDQPE